MADNKKAKATRAQSTNKKSKAAPKSPEDKTSSTTDMSVASAAPATTPSTPSKFFTLPPELRNSVYRYALVSDETIKVQFDSSQRGGRDRRFYFTMLPALATVSKQVRLESQRIFFEENQFEITPEMLKPRDLAPLIAFQKMYSQLGAKIRTLRVYREVKKRCNGDLFLFTGCFTVSRTETTLSISNEAYSATYIGRSRRVQATHHIRICGCLIQRVARGLETSFAGNDIVQYFKNLSSCYYHSRNTTDMSCPNEVVHQGNICYWWNTQRASAIPF